MLVFLTDRNIMYMHTQPFQTKVRLLKKKFGTSAKLWVWTLDRQKLLTNSTDILTRCFFYKQRFISNDFETSQFLKNLSNEETENFSFFLKFSDLFRFYAFSAKQ